MDAVFSALADPRRRRMVAVLRHGETSAGDIERALDADQPSTSRHLRVLRDAGLVRVRKAAQRRLYSLVPARLAELDAWLGDYRHFWTSKLDALELHLNQET